MIIQGLEVSEKLKMKFLFFIEKLEDCKKCWEWQSYKDTEGYGRFSVGTFNGKRIREAAHRFSHALFNEPLIPNMDVMHSCDNPGCVNPFHLSQVLTIVNIHDMIQKGRQKVATGLKSGMYTHPETRPTGDRNGLRKHPEARSYGDDNGSRKHPEKLKRGSEVNTAKLTEDTVREIRRLGITTSTEQIARIFHVSPSNIRFILQGKTWKHVV
jgi:hypothetical protein